MLTRRQLIATGAVALAFSTVLLRRHRAHAATLRYQVTRSEEEWRRLLTPEQYDVLRKAGTERRYTSALLNEHGPAHSIAPAAIRQFEVSKWTASAPRWREAPPPSACGAERAP